MSITPDSTSAPGPAPAVPAHPESRSAGPPGRRPDPEFDPRRL